jgi:hypothetical protein
LIVSARILLRSGGGKPSQANLRRAASTIYYALFHTLARDCANLLVGTAGSDRSDAAWRQVYRALNHGDARSRCQSPPSGAPAQIRGFADLFVELQSRRHTADYDPDYRTHKTSVAADIDAAEAVIDAYLTAPVKDRRAFAVWVLFKTR